MTGVVSRRRVRSLLLASVLTCIGTGVVDVLPSSAAVTATGTGSSYAAIALNNWAGQVSSLYGISINYQTQSSVLGLDGFANGQVNFGASEIGYSAGQSSPLSPPSGVHYQYLPDVAGAECMMYNLANTTQQPITNLQLNASTLMGIFSGTINYWDDPAIKTLNPKLISSLPHKGIVPVIRSDASGDNYIFSEYLSALEPTAWQKFMSAVSFTPAQAGNPATAQWPGQGTDVGQYRVGIFNQVSGSDNASNTVASSQNVGSITYVETAYAILHGMPCAAVQNESGRFVKPSSLADAIALSHDKLLPDLEQDLTGVFHAPEAGAYPISAYSYLITQTTGLNPSIGKVLGQFIQFFACQGQISAGQLGYSPLPINLVAEDFAAISRIPGAAKPPPINAKTCKNPYLTGAATYVGGPQVSTGSSSGANSSGAAVAATPSASSQAATAQVKTVSGAEASAQVLGKSHGGLTPVGNQTLGVALGSQATSLLSNSGMPSGTTLLAVLFLLAVVIPPVIAFELRRRRIAKESMVSQGDQE